MKKTLIALALIAAAVGAQAQHHGQGLRHHDRGHNYYGGNWVIPALVTGVIVYGVTREQTPPVQYVIAPVLPQRGNGPCPTGSIANYSRVDVQDTTGRFTETYRFTGCIVQ